MTEKPFSFFHPAYFLSTWFGSGLVPKIGGTTGTLAALPFAWIIHGQLGATMLLWFAVAMFLLGCVTAEIYVRRTGRQDPKEVVIDEVAGVCLLLSVMPQTPASYAVGFLLFRFFDILKPWPISWAERKVGGGVGVMLDDIIAALYPVILALAALVVSHRMGWIVIEEWINRFYVF